jgi:hypothetical protein
MPAYQRPIVYYLVIPTNATTGQRIVLDGVNGVELVYDSFNQVIASIAPGTGTSTDGQSYVAGIASYASGNRSNYSQLFNGQLVLNTPLDTVAAGAAVLDNSGVNSDQPELQLFSPAYSGIPMANAAYIHLFGANVGFTDNPYVRISARGGPAGDMDVQIAGTLRYASPTGSASETWHALSYAANWTDGPFAPGKYTRDANGRILFSGMIQFTGGATGAPITVFTLPVGYRPDRSMNLPLQDSPGTTINPATFTLQLGTNGVASITNFAGTIASGHLFSLEDLGFSLAQIP